MVQESDKPMDNEAQQAGEPQPGDVAQAVQQVDALQQELDAMKDKYLRALADCQNIQKRASAERVEAVQRGQADLARSLLPVLDNFERTLEAAKAASDPTTLTNGVQIIHEQMLKVLGEFGMQRMTVGQGDSFDPVYQQAVAQQPSNEVEPEHVLHVAQQGYTMRDKILRPATVVVAKQAEEKSK